MAKKTKDPKNTSEGETTSASKSGSARAVPDDSPREDGEDAAVEKPKKKKKKKRAPVEETRQSEATAADGDAADGDAADGDAADGDAADGADSDDAENALELAARDGLEGEDEGEEDDGDQEAVQLGIKKYVLATFFSGGMLLAYLLGRLSHSFWAYMSNRDWFSEALPAAAAIPDDSKLTYATVAGGIIAFFAAIRLYRHERFSGWVYDVAGELAKVKWPEKKEVTNYTITVIAATAMATLYLALLDRLWGFVTGLIYGHGPNS